MVRYRMIGRDINSSPTQYRVWVVEGSPDFTGELYTGLKSGPAPLIDIVAYEIEDDAEIVDFLFPDALTWETTKRTMPEAVANSQLAIIDGYAYLFGGEVSDKIWRASLDNPADWVDTGARLPNVLSGSSLAIIDSRIYLFGGRIDETVENIYSAPLIDPLSWTDHGPLLPDKIHKSSLVIADGYVYLFGGQKKTFAVDYIFRASTSDPLTWVDTGSTLPIKLYASQLAVLNDSILLIGGLLQEDSPTANVYSAPLSDPLNWSLLTVLPVQAAYGQFLVIGPTAYLFTPSQVKLETTFMNEPQPSTKILRCGIDSPHSWKDSKFYINGNISQSQFAIIYDRIFAFGGSGSSIIYASNQLNKVNPTDSKMGVYGNVTRTGYKAATEEERFQVLGFPWWKTDYATS